MKTDPRVDAFIAAAAPFAKPLLLEMRRRIQKALPDAVETIKWRMPFYEINGKIVANLAAFKAHTKFGIWQDMKPHMVDAKTAADLPAAADYRKQLKAAAEHVRAAAPKKAGAKRPTPSKTAPKQAPAKKKVAQKAPKKK
jgi:uncharacterized protein YdhG (YjbR/CyaY superfamily)